MSNLIVIRIVPQAPVTAGDFTNYLSALGGLQITAYDLSFDNTSPGEAIGTAAYIAPTSLPGAPTIYDPLAGPAPSASAPPNYGTTGIAQQVDLVGAQEAPGGDPLVWDSAYYAFQSVATAVIDVTAKPTFENLRLVASWGSGATAQAIPIPNDFYNVTVPSGTLDPSTWASLSPSLYVSLPAPPSATNPVSFQMPTDGTPPPFDALLATVRQILQSDPGSAVTVGINGPANAGATSLQFASGTLGITDGMAVSGAGVPNGTIVTAVGVVAGNLNVTLNQQISAAMTSGAAITFAASLASLTQPQCQNIASEIIWSAPPALPSPPQSDPIENLYTNPPNDGSLMSSGTSVNQYEGDRQEFEAQLKSYYAAPDANADRLANFVFALSAAIACEQLSLAADQVLLEFPVAAGSVGTGAANSTQVILTGIASIVPPAPTAPPPVLPALPATNFGVPAAFFYALGSSMPSGYTAQSLFGIATGDQLQHVLTQLTTAVSAQTIDETESFVTVTGQINAAQAARRIGVLGIPTGSSTPLAPLDTAQLQMPGKTAMGTALVFNTTVGVNPGMLVSGSNIAPGTTVSAVSSATATVTLSSPILNALPAGSEVVFTPLYAADMQALIGSWLAFPPDATGVPSPQSYQPSDDSSIFWPGAAQAQPAALLDLVLSAITQGYFIPAPFDTSLGDEILAYLKTFSPTPTIATLAAITSQQWTAFFKQNPTWLPVANDNGSGNTTARIANFIQSVQALLEVAPGGPVSSIDVATSSDAPSGSTALPFASTTNIGPGMRAITQGMRVTSSLLLSSGTPVIPYGTIVASTPTATSVPLSLPVAGDVPKFTNITFTPSIQGTATANSSALQTPPTDWIAACINLYNPAYTFGSGISNPANLKTAAASVFPGDEAAQDWLVDAITTIDALCHILIVAGYTIAATSTLIPSATSIAFSLMEALYARGFRSAADITALLAADFQEAVIGTVAFDVAGTLYTAAASITPAPAAPPSSASGFQPINSDGSLANCIPPLCLSPLGPIAYLNEILQVSQSSTCEHPLTPTASNSLGTVLATRRGPLGNLLASGANVSTPIPLIDIVNENLEFMGAATPPATCGTIYNTSGDKLAGFSICRDEPCPPEGADPCCHDAATIFGALPEHATPASPTSANAAVEPLVYNNLKIDFSSCCLPYNQALDVNRTYLRHLRSCRFEELRSFRKCITEFVLDPDNAPVGFQDFLWRYPVRIDTAIEYLGITPEEYRLLYQGAIPQPCAGSTVLGNPNGGNTPPANPNPVGAVSSVPVVATAQLTVWQLYGFATADENPPWTSVVTQVPEFLRRTCLTYCEFIELWRSGFVSFGNLPGDAVNGSDTQLSAFPTCEPCCLDKLTLQFPREQPAELGLLKLAVFIRLWRTLRQSSCNGYTFDQLRDICDVLQLFSGASLNPQFIRQLAAFQMLRGEFRMDLCDPTAKPVKGASDADRTQLLALWAQPQAAKWGWAVRQLIDRVAQYACRTCQCERRPVEFTEFMAANLDRLSRLAGFDPTSATDNWHASPSHTLRFAEVLAKLYASRFRMAEVFYLFTTEALSERDSPFRMQDTSEALAFPLDLPDEQHKHSLWELRRQLLEARAADDDIECWSWKRVQSELQTTFGFSNDDVVALGTHFFPRAMEHSGFHVDPVSTRFLSSLALASTSPSAWNTPPDGPFQYDQSAQQLWTTLPLTDAAVLKKLEGGHDLAAAEQIAVQDLYFQPRALLAKFALLFPDFAAAEKCLVEEHSHDERWGYFRRHFALCHARSRIIAEHLAQHLRHATGEECPDGVTAAALVLRSLYADENSLAPSASDPSPSWENDNGTHPPVTWTPPPNGGALAALLALVGTGLVGEYKPDGGAVVWRDVGGALSAFGRERDRQNCPVPTVLPALNATITGAMSAYVSVHNGLLLKDLSTAWLGGAQGFDVTWSGALLIEHEGPYEFWAGSPTPECEKPDFDAAGNRKWCITLKRGSRTWTLLSRNWPSQEDRPFASLMLRRGAYELTVELSQPTPNFTSADQVHPQHTGLQVKYSGSDSCDRRIEIPHDRLFSLYKDKPLGDGIANLSPGATAYLGQLYVSSLRDIRRTYQRAFKALLFAQRFALQAGSRPDHASELGYMLGHAENFAGAAFYRLAGVFTLHQAYFDFNYLPVRDDFYPPTPAQDQRVQPSPQRIQAMFDWWERMHDYTAMRRVVQHGRDHQLWQLFEEAATKLPADPGYLLRQIGAEPQHWPLDLRFFEGQGVAVYNVSSTDLEDDRWVVRAWHADRWLRSMQHFFAAKDIAYARPDLWASEDPSALVAAETQTGNANLLAFLCNSSFENGKPRRYEDVRHLNDGLRVRARNALLAYLCNGSRVSLPWKAGLYATSPGELSGLLLLDVEAGVCERASRIEEAITAAQSFIRRVRLGLEPGWSIGREFARLWDREFATFEVWLACKRRHLYKENWLEWSELEKARRIEAFQFLEQRLQRSALTVAAPGGLDWWPDEHLRSRADLELLQAQEPSELQVLVTPREGLNLLGTPERAGRPSWLTAVAPYLAAPPSTGGGSGAPPSAQPQPGMPSAFSGNASTNLPLWMQAAMQLGKRFYRIAAAGVPLAAMPFAPRKGGEQQCVTCCEECGCAHPPGMDEYYFWLVDGKYFDNPDLPSGLTPSESDDGYQYGFQDDFYDSTQQQSAYWEDSTQLPQLLEWDPKPMVRLAWCRVHNGVFQQPRRSYRGVAIQDTAGTVSDLSFEGRTVDSLFFSVSNAPPPQGYLDTTPPGFRYDLATDSAVTLPLVMMPPAVTSPFPGGLPAYPYFVYAAPGTHLLPLSPFAPAVAIARHLRAHCRFEPALKWYRWAFDPLNEDCTWIHCPTSDGQTPPPGNQPPNGGTPGTPGAGPNGAPAGTALAVAVQDPPGQGGIPQGACCDSADVSCAKARQRAVVLQYLETLCEWGHTIKRRGNSPEAFSQARVIFDAARLILGKTPTSIRLREPATALSVSAFKPEVAPLNPRLLDLYSRVGDQLDLIHRCVGAHRLHEGRAGREMPYFGNDDVREGWRTNVEPCMDDSDCCCLHSPYRFTFRIQKALEYAGKLQELGGAVLTATEKGDVEYLAAMRAGHEAELLALGLAGKQDQWRDADWQIESLQKTKAVSQTNLAYYTSLINGGLINGEIQYQSLINSSLSLRAEANAVEAIGEGLRLIPDFVVGAAGFGGSPVAISWLPLGTKLGEMFAAVARIMNNTAQIESENGQLDLTEAGWTRRLVEWTHQAQILTIEIQQIERQILGAQRHRDQMLVDINTHRRQMEQSVEVQNFLRDKFSNHELYLFMHREASSLYSQTYDLALCAARQAQYSFNLERGHTTRHFISGRLWDNLHEGLMAGERLSTALRHMEKAYFDANTREYELTKHVSLRLSFPMEFLRLRTTGCCEIDIPEWMFDQDFPGQYMRRIRSVTLTIPCVTGPYTGVHCRLTLLSSVTRIDPRLTAPVHDCCCPPKPHCCGEAVSSQGYELCPDDPRMVKIYGAREAIATSSAQNDSGLFELSSIDPRYLPFEYMGAVSRWRIELPPENNYLDLQTVTEAVLNINYTSREGGDLLREAALAAARRKLPGDGWSFFDLRHDFSDAWELFHRASHEECQERGLAIRIRRKFFPFLPRNPEIRITRIALLFETREMLDRSCPDVEGCPCPERKVSASHCITLKARDCSPERSKRDVEERRFTCYAADEWPDLYSGFVDLEMLPFRRRNESCDIEFIFPADGCEVVQAFLLCRYEVIEECCAMPGPVRDIVPGLAASEVARAGYRTEGMERTAR